MSAPDYASEIAALEAAAASGELRVESDGDLVIYRSMTDLLKALDYFRTRAAAYAGAIVTSVAPPQVTVAAFERD